MIRKQMGIHYVYGLYRPTGEPFYFGFGKNKRIYKHRAEAIRYPDKPTPKIRIIQKIWRYGLEFEERKLLCGLSEKFAKKCERKLISIYGRLDIRTGILANLTDGGDGPPNFSQETIAKMTAHGGMRNKHHSEDSIKRISESVKNLPEEVRIRNWKRAREAQKIKKFGTPESPHTKPYMESIKYHKKPRKKPVHLEGYVPWNKDKKLKPLTEAHKNNVSMGMKKYREEHPMSEEEKEHLRQIGTDRVITDQTRKNMSIAQLLKLEDPVYRKKQQDNLKILHERSRGVPHSIQHRQNISDGHRRRKEGTPEDPYTKLYLKSGQYQNVSKASRTGSERYLAKQLGYVVESKPKPIRKPKKVSKPLLKIKPSVKDNLIKKLSPPTPKTKPRLKLIKVPKRQYVKREMLLPLYNEFYSWNMGEFWYHKIIRTNVGQKNILGTDWIIK